MTKMTIKNVTVRNASIINDNKNKKCNIMTKIAIKNPTVRMT